MIDEPEAPHAHHGGTGTAHVIWFEVVQRGRAMANPRQLTGYSPRAEDHIAFGN